MQVQKLQIREVISQLGEGDGQVLTYRPLGKKAKEVVNRHIQKLLPGQGLELDFNGVELCDVSFVDEVVIEVQKFVISQDKDIIFFISNVKEAVLENLLPALAYRENTGDNVVVLRYEKGKASIFGDLEPKLRDTFELIAKRKSITARELAEINKIAINSASNRLKKLFDKKLLIREEHIDSLGRQHIYRLPL